jgi:hypothetical protein
VGSRYEEREGRLGEKRASNVVAPARPRTIHRQLALHAERVLDWFHIGMRCQNLKQLCQKHRRDRQWSGSGIVLAQLEHARWLLCNLHCVSRDRPHALGHLWISYAQIARGGQIVLDLSAEPGKAGTAVDPVLLSLAV